MKAMMNGTIILKDNFSDGEKRSNVIDTLREIFPCACIEEMNNVVITLTCMCDDYDDDKTMEGLNSIKDAFLFVSIEFVSFGFKQIWRVGMEDDELYVEDCYIESIPDTRIKYRP